MTIKILVQLSLAKRVAGPWIQDWMGKNKTDTKDTGHLKGGKDKISKTWRPSVLEPCPHKSTCLTLMPLLLLPFAHYLVWGPHASRSQRAKASVFKRQCLLLPSQLEKGEQMLGNSDPFTFGPLGEGPCFLFGSLLHFSNSGRASHSNQ